jgi:putative oxidoreductase
MKTILKQFIAPIIQKHWISDLSFGLIRIFCGLTLSLGFGADKFGVPWTADSQNLDLFEVSAWFPEDVKAYGGIFALAPVFFAWMAAFSEAVGGLFLALGIGTRLWAFLIMCTMLVAILCQKIDGPLWNMLPAIGFLWMSIYNLTLGSGRFGLDYVINKKL